MKYPKRRGGVCLNNGMSHNSFIAGKLYVRAVDTAQQHCQMPPDFQSSRGFDIQDEAPRAAPANRFCTVTTEYYEAILGSLTKHHLRLILAQRIVFHVQFLHQTHR